MDKTVIHSNQFIVASLGKATGDFSISPRPYIHESYASALHEAQRLAGQLTGKKFVVLAVTAVAENRPVSVPVVTTYSL